MDLSPFQAQGGAVDRTTPCQGDLKMVLIVFIRGLMNISWPWRALSMAILFPLRAGGEERERKRASDLVLSRAQSYVNNSYI